VRLLTLRQKCALLKHCDILGSDSDKLPEVMCNGVMIIDASYVELFVGALQKKSPDITYAAVEEFLRIAYCSLPLRD
jgi:hypothetical protein